MDIPLFPPKDHHHSFFPPTQPLDTSTTTDPTAVAAPNGGSTDKWAAPLLRECARAIADKDTARIHHLLWMLNELSSPYGDSDQKLAAYFLQALFCRATRSGPRCHRTLSSVADRSHSFDSARKHVLKFQEVSPWTTFGHVAANGAILEALDGEPRIHIIDLGSTLCTQWPTLLESLATRHDDTPHLTLTVVVPAAAAAVMKEIGQRMEKFARLMGVPFEFRAVAGRLADLTGDQLALAVNHNATHDSKLAGAAVAVNCVGAMRKLPRGSDRAAAIEKFRSLSPRVVTVVEEEADFAAGEGNFVGCFEECLRYYTVYFDMLEESFAATSNERLMLERESGRNMVRVLACDDDDEDGNNDAVSEWERRERGRQWAGRMKEGGFAPVGFSDDVIDDVKALLKRYRTGWELVNNNNNNNGKQDQGPGLAGGQQQGGGGGDSNLFLNHGFDHNEGNNDHGNGGGDDQTPGLFLTWKDEPVVWASAWKP
ncbi:unnamed protein product [Linum trigynum]|uniref:Uncharacterized protein n=1 Tax=Linum trigynum TaxID=586398 RepID=A0AAV2G511_9ROSI